MINTAKASENKAQLFVIKKRRRKDKRERERGGEERVRVFTKLLWQLILVSTTGIRIVHLVKGKLNEYMRISSY